MKNAKPSAWMLRTSLGLTVAAMVAIGASAFGFTDCPGDPVASPSEVRVVSASVTWREGARELSVVHVAEAAPRVAVSERGERRPRPSIVGREIRMGVAAMMIVVRLLASGKLDR
ncbi:MAG TPA: hypothetical protein VF613_06625 [Longimicrobium sp.]|jgi:hypothetical protein